MSAQAPISVASKLGRSRPLSVLCGIEPTLASLDAAHQAVEIAGSGPLAFASVATYAGQPLDAMYLDAAVFLARRDRGARDVRRVGGRGAVGHVLAWAARHDVLVVGAAAIPGELSALARVAIRRSPVPVLVARRLSRDDALGDRVVVVLGDAGGDARAAGLAAALARNAGAEIAATVTDAGESAHAVLGAARRAGATVIVIGGPATPRWRNAVDLAVTVAERASCSVLVARAASDPDGRRPGRE